MGPGEIRQYLASTVSQLSVLITGAAYCWFEPITIRLTEDPDLMLSSDDVSWLIAFVEFGALVSPIIAGNLADRVGRKWVILSCGPLCLIGWAVALFWKSSAALYFMRLVHGLATGVSFTVQPIYTAEIAEPKYRGRLSGTLQTALYLGVLYIFSVGPYLSYDYFIYASLPLPIIFTILFSFCPETPYYLLMKDRESEARKVLRLFRDSPDIEEELTTMKADVKEEMQVNNSWRALFCDKTERKAFIIVQIVCIAKFLTGMPVLINYAVETFAKSDSFLPPAEMSILLAALLTGIAVISAFLSDWIGRKPLLLISCFGCFVSHLFTGLYYFLHEKTNIDATPFSWMLYIGMVMYCVFSDIGLGHLLQTLQSELFGANTRGLAGGLTQGFGALWCFAAVKSYTPINEVFGIYLNFWIYGGVAMVSGLFLLWMMYETAGKRIGHMETQQS